MLEQHQGRLVSALQKIYHSLLAEGNWKGPSLPEVNGHVLTHDILVALDCMQTKRHDGEEVDASNEACNQESCISTIRLTASRGETVQPPIDSATSTVERQVLAQSFRPFVPSASQADGPTLQTQQLLCGRQRPNLENLEHATEDVETASIVTSIEGAATPGDATRLISISPITQLQYDLGKTEAAFHNHACGDLNAMRPGEWNDPMSCLGGFLSGFQNAVPSQEGKDCFNPVHLERFESRLGYAGYDPICRVNEALQSGDFDNCTNTCWSNLKVSQIRKHILLSIVCLSTVCLAVV